MGLVLFPLSLAMLIGGAAATYFGTSFLDTERGLAMVVSGSVVFSAGAVLMGLIIAGERLKRVERAILAATTPQALAAKAAASASPLASGAGETPTKVEGVDGLPESDPQARPVAHVVGRYSSGVNSYDMFADGSIRAMTPSGEHRFASMEEFRAFVTGGKGDDAPASKADEADSGPSAPAPQDASPTDLRAKA